MSDLIKRPILTMPEAEGLVLTAAYEEAKVILEYGSGGSTVIAAEMQGKRVFSVESDRDWLAMMKSYFAQNPPKSELTMHLGDIGPTKEWSFPRNNQQCQKWPGYPLSVWDLPGFSHPDVVLIDGRFRAACFLSTLFKIRKPTFVLWDDYIDRPHYHEVEELVKPTSMVGRMALFELTPMAIPADRLLWIIQTYLFPR